jgi:VanZ family protein
MPSSGSDSPFLRFLRAHAVEVGAALYFFVILYVTLLPFDFDATRPQTAPAGTWWGLVVARPATPDVASNIALYVPLGVLLTAMLVKWRLGHGPAIALAILLAAMLSFGSEYLQRFSPSRVCSLADFVANVIGAAGGGLASAGVVWLAEVTVRANRRDLRDCPCAVLAKLTALALVVAATVPFDFTFSPDRFLAAVKHLEIVPFQRLRAMDATISATANGSDSAAFFARSRDGWMLRMDYAAQTGGYAFLAVLTAYYLRRYCRTSVPRTVTWTFAACSILAMLAGSARLFVLSRGFDITYVVMGPIGALFGLILYGPLVRWWAPHEAVAPRSRKPLPAAAILCIAALIVLRETAPFLPVTTADSIAQQIARVDVLPMETYLQARLPMAAEDMLAKLIRFALLGVAISVWRATPSDPRRARPWATGFVVASATAVLELLQVLLPSRIPAVTDVLLAMFGTAAGVQMYRVAMAYHNDVIRRRTTKPAEPVRYDVELGPPEEGPTETVPREPVRHRQG